MGSSGNERRVGLARALSKLGYCSRSQATELIRSGHVRLNGATRRDPETPVRVELDRIEVDHRIVGAEAELYFMLKQPRGVRLDTASEGLLLLTNDSEWAARISDPETHLDKIYHVQVGARIDETLLDQMTKGIRSGSGEALRSKYARVLRSGQKNTWLEIVLDEWKNRQIRRMLELSGIEVLRLVRVAVGPLNLGNLAKGASRALSFEEKRAIDREMRTPR